MRALGASVMVCMLVAQPCFGQDKATIEKLNASFVAAFQKGDMEAIGRMYAEDSYLLPSGDEMVKGRSAIQAYWTKAANTIGDIKLITVDVTAVGPDAAREIGTFALQTKSQPPQQVAGKYVVLWQKIRGDWKLATDIWNMDK
jgi:uncharacterized protein (TIGR02246 family)